MADQAPPENELKCCEHPIRSLSRGTHLECAACGQKWDLKDNVWATLKPVAAESPAIT